MTISNSKLSILILDIIMICPFIKVFADKIIGNYQVVTIANYVIIILICILITIKKRMKLQLLYFVSILYFVLLFVFNWLSDKATFMQGLSTSMYFVYTFLISNYLLNLDYDKNFFHSVKKRLIIFFFISFVVSIIQAYDGLPFHDLFTNYGGNIIGSTILKNTRVTGGLGGTSIGYSFFLVLNYILWCFIERFIDKKIKYMYLVCLLLLTFMNYSRATFLCGFAILGYYILFVKVRNVSLSKKIVILLISIAGFIFFISSDNAMIQYIFVNDIYREHSNNMRILESINGIKSLNTLPRFLFGLSMGLNTGFSQSKILGDGALISIFIDCGFIGLLLFLLYFINIIKRMFNQSNKVFNKYFLVFSILDILAILGINSGYFENVNLQIMPYVFFLMLCVTRKTNDAIVKRKE